MKKSKLVIEEQPILKHVNAWCDDCGKECGYLYVEIMTKLPFETEPRTIKHICVECMQKKYNSTPKSEIDDSEFRKRLSSIQSKVSATPKEKEER